MKLTVCIPSSLAFQASFDGYKVYRLNITTEKGSREFQLQGLPIIELNHEYGLNGMTLDIAVPPDYVEAFDARNLTSTLLSGNLGGDIAAEGSLGQYPECDQLGIPGLSWFDSYHAYEDHVRYWANLHSIFPNNSELIEAGLSFEGRPIQGIHLWGSGGSNSKPAVFFNGNVHAREWITSMVVEYLLYQIVTGYENDTAVQAALDNYDFYVFPVVNPDGFVYSQTHYRLWRKNRQVRNNTGAIGTDINRNWPIGFGGDGSSPDPDSETFSGYSAADTPECASLIQFAQGLAAKKGVKLYIDWHSYAQVILLSYGYTCDDFPANIDRQIDLARETAAKIAQPCLSTSISYIPDKPTYHDNTTFDYGPGCTVLYQSSGNGRDYMTDAVGTEFGWGIELRSTLYGFIIPADQILPSCREIWEGMIYLWANM
ncbi:hypothetical protein GGR53DRAFT_523386 [Hypoxylon sp. FL1150]|nr:hypothetical protein GGR53DRAFT_523386 [Hypoxylon sp. FL1150]